MFARALLTLLVASAPAAAMAQADPLAADPRAIEAHAESLEVEMLEVDPATVDMLAPKHALDVDVRRDKHTSAPIRVARYRDLDLRRGLVHQQPGVRVIEAPLHRVAGASLPWPARAPDACTVESRRMADGRIALTIRLPSDSTEVHVAVAEGESVLVTGLRAPDSSWPRRGPTLGADAAGRTRLLFITPREPNASP